MKNILWGILIVLTIVTSIITFSVGDPIRNILMVGAFSIEILAIISIITIFITKIGLIWQLEGRKALFSYILAINFFALALNDFFFEQLNWSIAIYMLMGLICLYSSLKNYSLNNEKLERDYDFLYTLIVALVITIVKKIVDYFTLDQTYTLKELSIPMLNSLAAMFAITIFYLIIEYMNKQTGHDEIIDTKPKEKLNRTKS